MGMIRTVRIRGFKRFREVEFRLPGHVVLAGPNNTGKTTMLQAVASWAVALRRWQEVNGSGLRREHGGVPKGKRMADVRPRPCHTGAHRLRDRPLHPFPCATSICVGGTGHTSMEAG